MGNPLTVACKQAGAGWTCEVGVSSEGRSTLHTVAVSPGDLRRWGGGGAAEHDVEDLVRRSFEFLLEREPAASILERFDLAVIQRYFPEYDEEFSARSDG